MANFNKVLLMGNLTRDPDVRTTPSGMKIAKLGLAVNRRYRTRDDENREETTFVDIDAFGNQAELIERYCQKGTPLFIEGRLRLDQWESNTGEKRSKLTVVMENFQFLGSPQSQEQTPTREHSGSHSQPESSQQDRDSDSIEDDNVPF